MKKRHQNKVILAGMMVIAAGAYVQTSSMNSLVFSAQAKDGEEEASVHQEQDTETSKDSDNNESGKKAAEKARESAKKIEEIKKESAKKTLEIKNESLKKQTEFLKKSQENKNKSALTDDASTEDKNDDKGVDGVENNQNEDAMKGDGGISDNGNLSHRRNHAAEKIAEAEKYILEQQGEGKNVTIALERLAQAKSMLKTAETSSSDAQGKDEADDFVKEALKLAHTAKGDDIHSINDADKLIKKASDRIGQAKEKLSRLQSSGGDVTPYQLMINAAVTDLNAAKDLILNNSLLESAALAQKSEGEAKSAKKAIESALLSLGVEDDELSGDHKSVVAKAVEDLLYVANAEGENGIGKKVREIARSQRDSAEKVDGLIDDAQSRSTFAEFVLGPKYGDLESIQKQISDNRERIESLTQSASELTDADLKGIVEEHIGALTEENDKLQSFVSGKEKQKGIFGWVFRLLQ